MNDMRMAHGYLLGLVLVDILLHHDSFRYLDIEMGNVIGINPDYWPDAMVCEFA